VAPFFNGLLGRCRQSGPFYLLRRCLRTGVPHDLRAKTLSCGTDFTKNAILLLEHKQFLWYDGFVNIETLQIFCDVVRHQSFSRGAKANNVSQSAATQSVHRVEEYFGVQLVDRSKRPFVLTPEGQTCYEGFREVLELYNSVDARVRSLRNEISGLVRVAAIYSVGIHDMSRCMQDFMRRYPKAKVRLMYLRANKVYEAVLNGEADLGVVSYPAASAELDVLPLRSERMVVVCQPGHPLLKRGAVTAADLDGLDFIGFDRDLSIRQEIDRHLRQHSANIRVVMEFDNIETVKQAVEIGAGVSLLPEPTIRNEIRRGSLAAIPLVAPEMYRPLGIIHRQRTAFTPTAVKFIELLQEIQSQEPAPEDR